ncbi:MAG TPA: ATP-binding cassette domain-containing protein [Thermoanaerobaculia bacterium]|nr:ATP-binding cassette domain-containing protein [Thermoanaerobaculia bacterium]
MAETVTDSRFPVSGSGTPLFEARGITKRFGGLAAIDGVDLEIRRGEILGVIGPNGAGKTTFVNCITGLNRPTSGQILFHGEDITKKPSYAIGRMGIARTFQVVKPLKQLTVRDNVAIGAMFGARGRERAAGEARERAGQVLAMVGLEHRIEQTASELTVPDLKRLELAKALAMDPELLLLDEVMAGLNSTEVESAMELIRRINAGGVTILVIEHVMKAIMGISDRLAVLHYGRKIAEGKPSEIVESPRVIEAYLGERFAKRARAGSQLGRVTDEGIFLKTPIPEQEAWKPTLPLPGEPLLEIRDVSSGYGEVQILREVSLEVKQGEIVALIGANGAGKTTLLYTISQLARPRGGSIRFAGADLTRARPEEVVAAGIVHVPQGRRLFPGLTVEENLLQGVYLRRDRDAIEEDLEWVYGLLPRLKERSRQLAGRLSGGEQQMCAVGRGLMGRPKLLLIDELSLGLAPLVVDQLLEVISEINRKGTTVLLVEQDVQVALEHAHRGYVLETGRIVQAGLASDLLRDPRIRQAYLGL